MRTRIQRLLKTKSQAELMCMYYGTLGLLWSLQMPNGRMTAHAASRSSNFLRALLHKQPYKTKPRYARQPGKKIKQAIAYKINFKLPYVRRLVGEA